MKNPLVHKGLKKNYKKQIHFYFKIITSDPVYKMDHPKFVVPEGRIDQCIKS